MLELMDVDDDVGAVDVETAAVVASSSSVAVVWTQVTLEPRAAIL